MMWKHAVSFVAVFIFIFLFEFLFNSLLLIDFYQQGAAFVGESNIAAVVPITELIQFLMAGVITVIYFHYCKGASVKDSAIFGLFIGTIIGLARLSCYAYTPLSIDVAILWFASSFLQGAGIGIVLSETYKGCGVTEKAAAPAKKAPAKKKAAPKKTTAKKAPAKKKAAPKKK